VRTTIVIYSFISHLTLNHTFSKSLHFHLNVNKIANDEDEIYTQMLVAEEIPTKCFGEGESMIIHTFLLLVVFNVFNTYSHIFQQRVFNVLGTILVLGSETLYQQEEVQVNSINSIFSSLYILV